MKAGTKPGPAQRGALWLFVEPVQVRSGSSRLADREWVFANVLYKLTLERAAAAFEVVRGAAGEDLEVLMDLKTPASLVRKLRKKAQKWMQRVGPKAVAALSVAELEEAARCMADGA